MRCNNNKKTIINKQKEGTLAEREGQQCDQVSWTAIGKHLKGILLFLLQVHV